MRRIACARFGEDSSGMEVLMLDSTSRMASCLGTSGSAMSGSGWTRSSTVIGLVSVYARILQFQPIIFAY